MIAKLLIGLVTTYLVVGIMCYATTVIAMYWFEINYHGCRDRYYQRHPDDMQKDISIKTKRGDDWASTELRRPLTIASIVLAWPSFCIGGKK